MEIALPDQLATANRNASKNWPFLGLLYLLTGVLMLATWGRWPDLIIDFGRELYVPWQLAEGKVLYRDIAYFNGPFSPYFNALAFQLFGTSVATLSIVNGLILGGIVTLVYVQLLKKFGPGISAFACICFLLLQGFGHVIVLGNYNYISPYSHEMTHGILFCMLLLWLLHRSSTREVWQVVAAGICWGLTFLGKPEFFVAASGAVGISLFGPAVLRQKSWPATLGECGALGVGFALPIVGFWIFLFSQADAAIATQGIAGSWYWIFNSDVTQLQFYKNRAGTDAIGLNAWLLMRTVVAAALALVAIVLLARRCHRRNLAVAAVCLVLILLLTGQLFPVLLRGKVVACGIVILCGWMTWNAMRHKEIADVHLLAWSVLGSLLLIKIILNADLFEYGFALAMPALVLLVAVAIKWIPDWTCRGQSVRLCRTAVCLLLAVETMACVVVSAQSLAKKDHAICVRSQDYLLTQSSSKGPVFDQAMDYLLNNTKRDTTVLALPEGVMINYLLRRENPSPFINFMPPELAMFGEANMVRQFQNRPSDFVVLVNRYFWEYDKENFGEPGFGDQIIQWVDQNYEVVGTFGAERGNTREFGITVLQRKQHRLPTGHPESPAIP